MGAGGRQENNIGLGAGEVPEELPEPVFIARRRGDRLLQGAGALPGPAGRLGHPSPESATPTRRVQSVRRATGVQDLGPASAGKSETRTSARKSGGEGGARRRGKRRLVARKRRRGLLWRRACATESRTRPKRSASYVSLTR